VANANTCRRTRAETPARSRVSRCGQRRLAERGRLLLGDVVARGVDVFIVGLGKTRWIESTEAAVH
jgi:hypothetical protein